MSMPILATKLYIPSSRSKVVFRLRLFEKLNEGLSRNLILISAPAGFGKTTLVSEWVTNCERIEPKVRVAWLSLDQGDNDLRRFLTYLVAALQKLALNGIDGIAANIGIGALSALQSPQPPSTESILIALINEVTTIPGNFILVLDDYHVIETKQVENALAFLLEHLPPQLHLVIATREDPHLNLARLRARSQLTELRASDLRFTLSETAGFLNQMMGLNLSPEDIAALDTRTEGWIAGLQLAAIALQGTVSIQEQRDAAEFIKSFTGSHHFVMDYLVEEVLQQQSQGIQSFLLRTSILDRLCGPLCDAVCSVGISDFPLSGQETLEYLEHANLFIVPLDNERRWYRYHHLFAELLRQRLRQSVAAYAGDGESPVNELHIRASQWYEENGLEMEAFYHAAAANDIDRAARLVEGKGVLLHFRGAVAPIFQWLKSLPKAALDARPSLWVRYASLLLVTGQTTGVEEKLQAAETALQGAKPDDAPMYAKNRNLIGQIATARATLALSQYQAETIIFQAHRALEYLSPDNLSFRHTVTWALAFAYQLQGNRVAAGRTYTEAITLSQASGDIFSTILALTGLGAIQETENQLYPAAETYRRVLKLSGDHPQPNACEAHLGLARIYYEWNDLSAALQYGRQSLELARQYDGVIDRFIISEVLLARLKLVQRDVAGAAAILARTDQSARQHNFIHRIPEIAAVQGLMLLQQGNLVAAAQLAQTYGLPIIQARVYLAQGNTSAALETLEPLRQQVEAKGWADERLKVMILQAVANHAFDDKEKAIQILREALALAEPGGFIRVFIDEGAAMFSLLSEIAAQGMMSEYVGKLLAAFKLEQQKGEVNPDPSSTQLLIEPLSQRDLEVLKLIAQGLSNHEISERLFLALDTVKGHNRRIFDKLQVQRRTEAVARARELGLL